MTLSNSLLPVPESMDSARTIEISLAVPDSLHELLIAELAELDFESFVEGDDSVSAYIRARDWDDVTRETVERWLISHHLDPVFGERVYEPENWNRKWEETVRPVAVGCFLIKPTWADVPPGAEDRILLEIDPKMSFGTGYHESTRLSLTLLPDFVRQGARVLDVGTGTGVLAIAAARLGAGSALAVDVDAWSYTNAMENVYLNGVAEIVTVASGSLELIPPDSRFDLILANINRSVLIEMLPEFQKRLAPGGHAILAGILTTDREILLRNAAHWALRPVREAEEGMWWAVCLGQNQS